MRFAIIITLFFLLLLSSCSVNHSTNNVLNPPAAGFLATESDAEAVKIADQVMEANGGRALWDNTRYLSWNFVGRRKHVWDKSKGMSYIENPPFKSIISINDQSGTIWKDDVQLTQKDSIQKYVQKAYEMWVNDSYWLVMPFKLKDTGVRLQYVDEAMTSDSIPSDRLALTFQNTGVTPNNKYHIYIAKDSHLIRQWDFFTNATDSLPRFAMPWKDYKSYNGLMLSGDHGRLQLTEIEVGDQLMKYFE